MLFLLNLFVCASHATDDIENLPENEKAVQENKGASLAKNSEKNTVQICAGFDYVSFKVSTDMAMAPHTYCHAESDVSKRFDASVTDPEV